MAALAISEVARSYRRIWRDCFLAGFLGLLALAPLIGALQVEAE